MTENDAGPQRTTVIDDNIGDYTKPQLFFRLAVAYADSSHHIVRSMLAGELPATFAHAQTTHFLFDHAVELFLKGAILKITGKLLGHAMCTSRLAADRCAQLSATTFCTFSRMRSSSGFSIAAFSSKHVALKESRHDEHQERIWGLSDS